MSEDKIMNLEMEIEIKDKTIEELERKIIKLENKLKENKGSSGAKKGPKLIEKKVSSGSIDLIEELKSALQTKDVQLKSLEGKLNIQKTDIINLKNQLKLLKEELKAKDEKIVKLENKKSLSVSESAPSNLTELIDELRAKISKQNLKIEKLKKELNEAKLKGKGISTAKELKIKEIKTGGDTQKQIQSLKQEISKLNDTIYQKDKRIKDLEEQIKELSAQSKEQKVPAGELGDLVMQLQQTKDKLKRENKKLKSDLEKYKHLEKAKKELDEKRDIIKEQKEKIDNLNSKLIEYKSEIDNLNGKIKKLTSSDKDKQWQNLLDMKEKDLEKYKEDVRMLRLENHTLKTHLEELENKVRDLEVKLDMAAIDELKRENLSLIEEKERFRKQMESYKERINELEKELERSGVRQQMMRIRELQSQLEGIKRRNKQQLLEITDLRRRLVEEI
ncbi:MAG: hypothetical protein ACTSU2_04105 [Promethearchaeota archaeon]